MNKNNEMYEAVGRLDTGLWELDRTKIANRLGGLSGKYLAEAGEVIDKLNKGSELTETEKVKIACWLGWLSGGELE